MLKDCWTLLHCTFWVLLLSDLHLKNTQKPVWTGNFLFFLSFSPLNASFRMTVWFYYSMSETAYVTYSIHSEDTKQHLIYFYFVWQHPVCGFFRHMSSCFMSALKLGLLTPAGLSLWESCRGAGEFAFLLPKCFCMFFRGRVLPSFQIKTKMLVLHKC